MFEGCPDRQWHEGEARKNKMVFIGRNLDGELLREGFEDCLYVEAPVEAAV
jgi:G3E family GTPase